MLRNEYSRFIATSAFAFILSTLYLLLLVLAIRNRLWLEITISIILPILLFAAHKAKYMAGGDFSRVRQLFIFESYYNVLAISSMILILLGSMLGNTIAAWGFVAFFVIQAGGFFAYQLKRKKIHGLVQSSCVLILITAWWWGIDNTNSIIDPDGRFLMWGENAPLAVQLIYVVWAVNSLLADTAVLPRFSQAIFHFTSIAVAMWSGDFFHVRLFTACHLFLLDGVLGFTVRHPFGNGFATLPEKYKEKLENSFQPFIARVCTGLALLVMALSFFGGLNLEF